LKPALPLLNAPERRHVAAGRWSRSGKARANFGRRGHGRRLPRPAPPTSGADRLPRDLIPVLHPMRHDWPGDSRPTHGCSPRQVKRETVPAWCGHGCGPSYHAPPLPPDDCNRGCARARRGCARAYANGCDAPTHREDRRGGNGRRGNGRGCALAVCSGSLPWPSVRCTSGTSLVCALV